MTSRPTSPNATLVNTVTIPHNERPSVKLKIPSGKSNTLNSAVVDAAGQSLYKISSNSKRTTFVACKDNVEVATVQWDRSSPRIVFRQKKMKCKEWLPLAGPESESAQAPLLFLFAVMLNRDVTSPGLAYSHTVARNSFGCRGHLPPLATCVFPAIRTPLCGLKLDLLQLIPANRPGLAVARWHVSSHSDDLYMDMFQDSLVEPSLLEAIVLSVVLLRSGRSLDVDATGMPDAMWYTTTALTSAKVPKDAACS